MTEKQQEIYHDLVNQYGVNLQRQQVAEECVELAKEVLKFNRTLHPKYLDKCVTEIGDVLNAIDSFLYIHDLDIEDINKARFKKLAEYHSKNIVI
jgi:NTP pyrophosphatase (non-canonical NTP hydrolase)